MELCKKENRMKLTNTNFGKILFKYFRSSLKDKSKEDVTKYVFDIVNYIENENINNETLYIKCIKKEMLIIVLKHNFLL